MKKDNKKKVLIIVIGIIVFCALGIYMYIVGNYKLGMKKYDAKEYKNAVEYFDKIIKYKDAEIKKNELYYLMGIEEREKENFEDAIIYFSMDNKYKDTDEQIKETKYEYAIYEYNTGELDKAKMLFEEIKDENDVEEYMKNINILLQMQGIWRCDKTSSVINIKNNMLESYSCFGSGNSPIYNYRFDNVRFFKVESRSGEIKLEGNKIKVVGKDFKDLEWDEENKTINSKFNDSMPTNSYIKDNGEITEIKAPEIGMNKYEVIDSTWGSPEKINKTMTSYGKHEQWCYSNYRYIYFENEIVTSIQE